MLKEVPVSVPKEFELNPKAQTINIEGKYTHLYKKLKMGQVCNTGAQMEIPFQQMILDKNLDRMEILFSHPPPSFRKKMTDDLSEYDGIMMNSKLNS